MSSYVLPQVAHCAIGKQDFQRPSKTRANKKVAIKKLLCTANQVVFFLALDEKRYCNLKFLFARQTRPLSA
jgi:hypothetical protein